MDANIYFHLGEGRKATGVKVRTDIKDSDGVFWARIEIDDLAICVYTNSTAESAKFLRDLLNETLRTLTTPKED